MPRRLPSLPVPLVDADVIVIVEVVPESPVLAGSFAVAAPHAPCIAIATVVTLPDLQLARLSSHALLYVMPFEPHTGANTFLHAFSHLDSLGFGALVPG